MSYIGLNGILSRLHVVKPGSGNGDALCRCPAHDDRRASLCVREGDKGIILKCHAGCTTEAICGAIGVEMRDLFRESEAPQRRSRKSQAAAAAKPAEKMPEIIEEKTYDSYEAAYGRLGKLVKVYPYTDADGKLLFEVARIQQADGKTFRQHRPAYPERGKFPILLKVPSELRNGTLYRLPEVIEGIQRGETIFVVEGEKDADTMFQLGYCATTCAGGGKKWMETHSDLLAGADIAILPDNDATGESHGKMVADSTLYKCNSVRLIRIPDFYPTLPEKGDISDVAEMIGETATQNMIERMLRETAPIERDLYRIALATYNQMKGYGIEMGCTCQQTADGSMKPLGTFVALPVRQLIRDDGVNIGMALEIMGWDRRGKPLPKVTVDMDKFSSMSWAPGKWGLAANIMSGQTVKDKLRYLIASAGAEIAKEETIYAHSGWRKIHGKWCYLYDGGCIGADGLSVQMDGKLSNYSLSGVPEGLAAIDAALTSFSLTQIIPEHISVPMLGIMYLAPLREFLQAGGVAPAFPVMLKGGTGTHKSTTAALFLSHYGDFDILGLPANYQGTVNSIRRMAFQLKDMPLVVDDYHPTASLQERRKMESVAQAISRMFGDNADRGRLTADLKLQDAMPPRSLCITTTEELPDIGESGINRFYIINIGKDEIPFTEEYVDMQERARNGELRAAMRGYIEWLIPQADSLCTELRKMFYEYRTRARELLTKVGAHDRAAPMVAHIMIGITEMMRYCESLGMIDRESADTLIDGYWSIVAESSVQQAETNRNESPLRMFMTAISEMMATKAIGVADLTPGSEYREPSHGMVGYMDQTNYYFHAGTLYGAVVQFYADQNRVFSASQTELQRMLREEGIITQTGSDGKTTRSKRINGKPLRLLWLPRWRIDGGSAPEPEFRQNKMDFKPVPENELPEEMRT